MLPDVAEGWEWLTHGDVVVLTAGLGGGCRAAFATRRGGVSTGEVAGLNLGRGDPVADDNRRLLCAAVGVDAGSIAWARQVHGRDVAVADLPGRAAAEADVLVTYRPGITLMGLYADCVPVVVADWESQVIALAHAGWRGTAAGIVRTAVQAVRDHGGRVDVMRAVIGPAIGKCCYEVGADVAEKLTGKAGRDGQKVDLKEINRQQLRTAGIRDDVILVSDICTSCNSDLFYSYRRSGGTSARFGVLAWLEEGR